MTFWLRREPPQRYANRRCSPDASSSLRSRNPGMTAGDAPAAQTAHGSSKRVVGQTRHTSVVFFLVPLNLVRELELPSTRLALVSSDCGRVLRQARTWASTRRTPHPGHGRGADAPAAQRRQCAGTCFLFSSSIREVPLARSCVLSRFCVRGTARVSSAAAPPAHRAHRPPPTTTRHAQGGAAPRSS